MGVQGYELHHFPWSCHRKNIGGPSQSQTGTQLCICYRVKHRRLFLKVALHPLPLHNCLCCIHPIIHDPSEEHSLAGCLKAIHSTHSPPFIYFWQQAFCLYPSLRCGIIWGKDGKYRFMSDSDDPYEVHFMFATCPIVENSRLPLSKQSKEYKGIFCPISRDCKFQECFPKKANVRDSYAI